MAALPLTSRIHDSSNKTTQFRTQVASFGDGYSQRAADGLNSKVDSFEILWPGLDEAEKNTVLAVLDAVGSWDILTWTPPGEAALKKFVIDPQVGYSIQFIGKRYSIATAIKQVFDL